MSDLVALASHVSGRRIAVVGDVMLDHFIVGHVERISPEAPVPVVRFLRDDFRLGGAANVAHNVASLGGRASLVGLVGDDEAAARVRQIAATAGLDARRLVVDSSRPTTRKVRVVTSRNQQVARIDYEQDGENAAAVQTALIAAAVEAVRDADAVVLSDYRKGVVTPPVIAAVVAAAKAAQVPLLIDPKVANAERYRGASVLTPNHHEAEEMTQTAIRTPDAARAAARLLHERTGANILITWGERGMWIFDASPARTVEEALPAVAREVSDVTGAGDTVIAVLALSLAAGASLRDAARLANIAAGLVVGRFGPSAISARELASAAGA